MRPKSIIVFEWLYLGSAVLSLAMSPWTIPQAQELLRANPASAQFEDFAQTMTIVSLLVGVALSLVLWYFIARRASNVAKWIFVAITLLGTLSAINLYVNPAAGMARPGLSTVPMYVLHLAAMYCLFRQDAVAWLEGKTPVDVRDFD